MCWGRLLILTLKLESIHHRVQRSLEVQEVHEDKTSRLLREADEEGKRSEGRREAGHGERGKHSTCDRM